MKKAFIDLFTSLFIDFKFARKMRGGTWYYLRVADSTGFAGTSKYWTQHMPGPDEVIIKEEIWPGR